MANENNYNSIDELKTSIEKLTVIEKKILRTQSWWYGFFHGLAAAMGGTVGVAIVLSVLLKVLTEVAGVPGIGHWSQGLLNLLQRTTGQ